MKKKPSNKKLTSKVQSAVPMVKDKLTAAAKDRLRLHRDSPSPKIEKDGDNFKCAGAAGDQLIPLLESFGSGDFDFIQTQMNHLLNVVPHGSSAAEMNAQLAFMRGLAPKDEIESHLGAQMAAVHELAMICMRRTAKAENYDVVDRNLNQANKLLKTFLLQMETLNRYRGKGQQRVTVEHVTVNSGGQAIVGAVNSPEPDKGGGVWGKPK